MDNVDFDVTAMLSPPDIFKCKRVLCVQPHPDDIEIGMGGVVAVLAQAGCEVHYLTVTNGDQGNNDRSALPLETEKIRRKEAVAAGKHLGAAEFYFLDHGDGTLNDVLSLSIEIASVIRQIKPDAVFSPDPWLKYEGHYDHVVTGRAVSNAFQMSGRTAIPDGGKTAPCYVGAIGYYFTPNPNVVIDVTGVFDKKFEAIALHKSQMDEATLAMFRFYFEMKGRQLAQGKGFDIGEGLKVLSPLHTHCFVDADKI